MFETVVVYALRALVGFDHQSVLCIELPQNDMACLKITKKVFYLHMVLMYMRRLNNLLCLKQ